MPSNTPGDVETRLRAQLEAMKRWSLKEKADLLEALEERFGAGVEEVVARVVEQHVRHGWEQIAARRPGHTIEDLVGLVWEPARADGFEFSIEAQNGGIMVTCTRCPACERARQVGAVRWGYQFHCATDPHIVAAFNDSIGYRRTQTLMEGYDSCDHFYYMKEGKVKP